jgi:hypothetical protein
MWYAICYGLIFFYRNECNISNPGIQETFYTENLLKALIAVRIVLFYLCEIHIFINEFVFVLNSVKYVPVIKSR